MKGNEDISLETLKAVLALILQRRAAWKVIQRRVA